MNMKRTHANHIAENQAVIAELTSRLADRDEVQKQQHMELLAHQDLQLSQSKEIERLRALCQEPVVIQADELKNLRNFRYRFVTIGGSGDVNDAGLSIYFEIATAINAKLKERK